MTEQPHYDEPTDAELMRSILRIGQKIEQSGARIDAELSKFSHRINDWPRFQMMLHDAIAESHCRLLTDEESLGLSDAVVIAATLIEFWRNRKNFEEYSDLVRLMRPKLPRGDDQEPTDEGRPDF